MIDPTAIRVTRLDNGLTLLTERIPTVRSASVGIWVKRGSRDELPGRNGVAHFVEHMLFKGTTSRSARDIAFAIDAMGGQLDAFTTKESTGYYAMVLDEQLPRAFDLLADLVTNPRFDPADMDREREVILEEIAEAEDDPEDVLVEEFFARFWAEHPMGLPILGTRPTVSALTPEMLRETLAGFSPGELVISAAGNLEHGELEQLVTARFGDRPGGNPAPTRTAPECHSHLLVLGRQQMEQVQLYVACDGPHATDPDRFDAHLLNTVLGGSVSSRLFQTIREERGLAYSVYSSLASYSDAGYLMVSAGTRPPSAALVVELVLEELERLRQEPVPDEELERMKDHLKGGLMLSLENTFGRMANLARQEIAFGRTFSLDEILAGIDSVDAPRITAMAQRLFDPRTLSVGLVAREDVAEALERQFADGLPLPAGGKLMAAPS